MTDALNKQFEPFAAQMQAAGLAPIVIETFKYYYSQLAQGQTGLISENELETVSSLPDAEKLQDYAAAGRDALKHTAIIKLNGGLGTSMGLEKAKSLLTVKDGLSFLDIIARQALELRQQTGSYIPLILMNSFSTEEDSLTALQAYPELAGAIPLSFTQNKIPKVLQDNYQATGNASELGWCPPGHGDIYTALQTSGMLQKLIEQGYQYLFVSNADNLGAVMDEQILGYFAESNLPFLMEVADRTEADSKGGHLARRKDGRLVLREIAQCPPEELENFSNIRNYSYFNTNNLWIHLPALQAALQKHQQVLKLPLIRNSKTLDPRDATSPKVYQLETAMGAAIEVFEGAGALRVPRTRFAPVKLSSDLLALWSDAYVLTPDSRLVANPKNKYGLPVVKLDNAYYKFVDALQERFPAGAPSLKDCETLKVEGDVKFGQGVVIQDQAQIINSKDKQVKLEDGAIVKGTLTL